MTQAEDISQKRRRLRLVAALPLPLLVALWALWRDVFVLDAGGVERVGDGRALVAWALLSLASAGLVGLPVRPGASAARDGLHLPRAPARGRLRRCRRARRGSRLRRALGDLAAPLWALGALAATALACAVAIVATAALFVIDVREAEDEP